MDNSIDNSMDISVSYSQNYSCTTKVPTFNCGIINTQYNDMSLYYRKANNTELLEKRMKGSECEK